MRSYLIPRLAALLAFLGCVPPAPAAAEFRAALGSWRYDITGTVTDRGETYDFQDDLALRTAGRRSVLLELDTGRGWWPDWSASFSQLGASGMHEETVTIFPFPPQTRSIAASADFDDHDLTARYPFQWGGLRVSAGVTVKRLRGTIVIDDSDQPQPSHQHYDETFPELHAQLRWPLGRALTLTAAGQGIEYDGSSAMEWRAGLEIRLLAPLLLEAGWQEKRYKISVNSYRMDAQLDGVLLRVGFLWR